MTSDFVLRGGNIIDPATELQEHADLWIAEGKIAGIGPEPQKREWHVIDVSGLIVCPGLVDIHTHLREPGQAHKETIATGTRAAIAGGFTSVCCMPNTQPAIDRPGRVAQLLQRIERDAVARVFIIGAATIDNENQQFTDVTELAKAGCVALTDDAFPLQTIRQMREALRMVAPTGLPFVAHCEDHEFSGHGVVDLGAISRGLDLPGQDSRSEVSSFRKWHRAMASLESESRPHLHVAHASTAALIGAISEILAEGHQQADITAEVTPHHLALTQEAVREFGPDAKMNPPLRTEADRRAIRQALKQGIIGAIATDHAPHTPDEKNQGLLEAPFGVIGLETALGVTLTELYHSRDMPLESVLALLTCGPARIFGLTAGGCALGSLQVGSPADITIIDPDRSWTVDPEQFESKSRNTPFAGRTLKGKPWGTIAAGQLRMRECELQLQQ